MKYTADSWFFVQLNLKKEKALKIWKEITIGKSKLVVPTVVITEITKRFLRKNLNNELESLLLGLEQSDNIFVVGLSPKIAELAGKIGHSFNVPTIDSIIISTAIISGFPYVLTDDNHYIPADKAGKIKLIKF